MRTHRADEHEAGECGDPDVVEDKIATMELQIEARTTVGGRVVAGVINKAMSAFGRSA